MSDPRRHLRPLDESALSPKLYPLTPQQALASRPDAAYWVSASAGTGKTHMLSARVLRLLLNGTMPERILCLTYTRAAAGEMAYRISEKLAEWVTYDNATLEDALKKLIGRNASDEEILRARCLFARVCDSGSKLKIMTLHAFCQSVLERFPGEAALPPDFAILDERAQEQLRQTLLNAMLQNASGKDIIFQLGQRFAPQQIDHLIKDILAKRWEILAFLSREASDITGALRTALQIPDTPPEPDWDAIRCVSEAIASAGGKTDRAKQRYLLEALALQDACMLIPAFLTQKGTKTKTLVTTPVHKVIGEDMYQRYSLEAEHAYTRRQIEKSHNVAETSELVIRFAAQLIALAETQKAEAALVDYDDLTHRAALLLANEGIRDWVLYQLDGGIDHILLDESQDTSPAQWRILDHLTEEARSGHGSHSDTVHKTVFCVGDEKQSIYSFQGADQESYRYYRERYTLNMQDVPLTQSFRSVPAILDVVDACFQGTEHQSARQGYAGKVEIWPALQSTSRHEDELYLLPVTRLEANNPYVMLSRKIAETISGWIKSKTLLPSKGRPINAGDIMILLRKRGKLAAPLLKALKDLGVPVGGLDRMVLREQIIIRDLLAICQVALNPLDDLALAIALRTPVFDISEDALFDLCYDRKDAPIYERLSEVYRRYLDGLQDLAAQLPPYNFLKELLQAPCPGDKKSAQHALLLRLGMEAFDPLQEMLSLALAWEQAEGILDLTNFLAAMQNDQTDLKRELDSASGGFVRIMTVHGAKGLQAPIVFLPETFYSSPRTQNTGALLFHDGVPLCAAGKKWGEDVDNELPPFLDAKEETKQADAEEYNRLLYVAMTRAEDQLYVCGIQPSKGESDRHWYTQILNAVKKMPGAQQIAEGHWVYETAQEKEVSVQLQETRIAEVTFQMPPWVLEAEPETNEQTDKAEDNDAARRGTLIHHLFEVLPDVPAQDRQDKALATCTETFGLELEDSRDISKTVLTCFMLPEYLELLKHPAKTECELADQNGHILRIDRLIFTPENAVILDYKTGNRPEKMPATYQKQLMHYARTIAPLANGKPVRTALLWVDDAALEWLDQPQTPPF